MWQQFLQRRAGDGPAFLSVAVDVEPERVRPYAAPYSFPTVVDRAGLLGRTFDFDVVPNGLLIDEAGVLRFQHVGGFDIRRPEVEAQLRTLLATGFEGGASPALLRQEALELELLLGALASSPDDPGLHFALGEALLQRGRPAEAEAALRRAALLDPRDWSAPFALGVALHQQKQTAEALAHWHTALALDPKNFTVRKQIWMVEHPERFYPTIDFGWQKEQLAREGVR